MYNRADEGVQFKATNVFSLLRRHCSVSNGAGVQWERYIQKVTGELQLHSDQGFQYTSQAYFNLTQSYDIKQSMSRRGNPYDNALAENFFSILKTECIHRVKLKTYEQARMLIGEYINYYNNYRIQTKTKLTPLEKRCQYVA